MHTVFLLAVLMGIDDLEELGINYRIILKRILKEL
jgi:hypothetical protein